MFLGGELEYIISDNFNNKHSIEPFLEHFAP